MNSALSQLFKLKLQTEKVSVSTVKNYYSDANDFIDWLCDKYRFMDKNEPGIICKYITIESVSEFKNYLVKNKANPKTIKRKLSSIKRLVKFAFSNGWITEGSQKIIQFLSPEKMLFGNYNFQSPIEMVIENFRNYLAKQKISHITAKNYASDIRNFLTWLNQNG